MVGSGPHQAGSHQPEPARSQQQGNFPNPEHDRNEENGRFREESAHTIQTSKATLVWAVTYPRARMMSGHATRDKQLEEKATPCSTKPISLLTPYFATRI